MFSPLELGLHHFAAPSRLGDVMELVPPRGLPQILHFSGSGGAPGMLDPPSPPVLRGDTWGALLVGSGVFLASFFFFLLFFRNEELDSSCFSAFGFALCSFFAMNALQIWLIRLVRLLRAPALFTQGAA